MGNGRHVRAVAAVLLAGILSVAAGTVLPAHLAFTAAVLVAVSVVHRPAPAARLPRRPPSA